jgi:hypothetical protein
MYSKVMIIKVANDYIIDLFCLDFSSNPRTPGVESYIY